MWPSGLVTHYNVTIWAGNPLQFDHPEKSSYFSTGQVTHYNVTILKNHRIFKSSGRSPGTIRPLAKFFAFLLSSGRMPKTIWSIKKKWVVFQMTCSLCKSHVFEVFKTKKKKKFFPYLLFFINLLHKAKENEIFQCLCIVNIIKRGQLS